MFQNQKSAVLNYLREFGPITPLKAMSEFRIMRLAAVVKRLRNDGHDIHTTIRKTYDGRPYAEYSLRGIVKG